MRTILNVIWVILGGFWLALGYMLAGVIACIFIVTIPAGLASFRMANYVLWPFGRTVEPKPGAGWGSGLMNVIWFVVAGWWLALLHITSALAQSLTVIGIANAWVSLKMIPVTCFPFGKRIVPSGGIL
ncbi:YccF domain-containing protein [Tessaracoccus sp. MC1865]|uniref:YccF domain-containing protein n=1 Tax=Tessaracoccus sp. MC1865 TaxID=2760310 RepID=UPI00160211B3|nr:YccF domain-containing protein [Tessaracoccus sp. MC1865]MBB1483704.1 YccF domain-containing protein [Tessaracoccus sp. MC1865]QTO36774.1 YccF domain-containing protein [Tessaracoccus sp. MC1865]